MVTDVFFSLMHRIIVIITSIRQIFWRKRRIGKRHVTISERHKQRVSFFIIKIQPYFKFEPDWYRRGEVRGIVTQYYYLLRSILKSKPHLKNCLAKCKHCQIFFFTHPRNAGRTDLGCPFGCRQTHRRKSAIKRSVEYYRSPAGKIKKGYLNKRRNNQKKVEESKQKEKFISNRQIPIDEVSLAHMQTATSLIEGRSVSMGDIIIMLTEIMRQLSIDIREGLTYGDRYLGKIPP